MFENLFPVFPPDREPLVMHVDGVAHQFAHVIHVDDE